MIFSQKMRRNSVKITGERSSAMDLARGRLVMMGGFFILVFFIFAVRAFDLSVIQGEVFSADNGATIDADKHQQKTGKPLRADITDRNGVLLATTLKTASLYADTKLIADPQGAAQGLVKIFPALSYGDVLQKLQSGKRFVWIHRALSPQQQYQVLQLGEPGLDFEYAYQRFYPQGEISSHIIGYSNIDSQGLSGVERGFNNILNEGHSLKLTMDIRLQHALRREIKRAIDEFGAHGGSGVIMDVANGEVLAGVSLPDFNPHKAGDARPEEVFNTLSLGTYELGSVFKIFSTAAFFENYDVGMATTFDAREPIKVGRFKIRDFHAQNRVMTIPEVFMYSSNIGSALMGQAVGTEKLKNFYADLGLLSPMDIEIKEVAAPQIPQPWREINTLTASYGHGLATTPLQMTAAVSSIINGGYLVKPRFVLSDEDGAQNLKEEVRVVSEKTAEKMRQLMRLVVSEGTGSKADVKGLRVGGKTGTADKSVNGVYHEDRKISSFVGVFPMEAPRYAVFIMVDDPKGREDTFGYATGGWVAAPATARVISSMAAILGIVPANTSAPENNFAESLKQYVSTKGHE